MGSVIRLFSLFRQCLIIQKRPPHTTDIQTGEVAKTRSQGIYLPLLTKVIVGGFRLCLVSYRVIRMI